MCPNAVGDLANPEARIHATPDGSLHLDSAPTGQVRISGVGVLQELQLLSQQVQLLQSSLSTSLRDISGDMYLDATNDTLACDVLTGVVKIHGNLAITDGAAQLSLACLSR